MKKENIDTKDLIINLRINWKLIKNMIKDKYKNNKNINDLLNECESSITDNIKLNQEIYDINKKNEEYKKKKNEYNKNNNSSLSLLKHSYSLLRSELESEKSKNSRLSVELSKKKLKSVNYSDLFVLTSPSQKSVGLFQEAFSCSNSIKTIEEETQNIDIKIKDTQEIINNKLKEIEKEEDEKDEKYLKNNNKEKDNNNVNI